MDACITPIRHGGLSLVQSTSFFYVLVDDPYMMVTNFDLFYNNIFEVTYLLVTYYANRKYFVLCELLLLELQFVVKYLNVLLLLNTKSLCVVMLQCMMLLHSMS